MEAVISCRDGKAPLSTVKSPFVWTASSAQSSWKSPPVTAREEPAFNPLQLSEAELSSKVGMPSERGGWEEADSPLSAASPWGLAGEFPPHPVCRLGCRRIPPEVCPTDSAPPPVVMA